MEIRKLNTLRGLAALIVLVSHYSNATGFLQGLLGTGAGQFGVMLFFMLSGFLMSYLYMGQAFVRFHVYRYVVARIARVVPLFLLVVFGSYGLMQLGVVGVLYDIPDIQHLLAHLFLLFGTSVLWTIPAEVQFYGLFVLFWWVYQVRGGMLFIGLAAVVVLLILLGLPRFQGEIGGLPFDVTLTRALPYFLLGLVFGQVYLRWSVPSAWLSGFYILALLLIPLLYPNVFRLVTGGEHGMWQDLNVLFVMGFVFFVVVFLVPERNVVLANRIGDFLGRISYSLYLLHEPVLWQIKGAAVASPNVFFGIFLGLSLGVAFLSYWLVEWPAGVGVRWLFFRKKNRQ